MKHSNEKFEKYLDREKEFSSSTQLVVQTVSDFSGTANNFKDSLEEQLKVLMMGLKEDMKKSRRFTPRANLHNEQN